LYRQVRGHRRGVATLTGAYTNVVVTAGIGAGDGKPVTLSGLLCYGLISDRRQLAVSVLRELAVFPRLHDKRKSSADGRFAGSGHRIPVFNFPTG